MFCKRCHKQHDGQRKTCDYCLIKIKEWAKANPEKIKLNNKKPYKRNLVDYKLSIKKHTAKSIEKLLDGYIKSLIIKNLPKGTSTLLIPQELIDAKRTELKLKRLIKEMKK